MKRRDFLRSSSAFSLPILLNGMGITAVAKSALFNHINTESDKVLILIYMGGGNDGLNTLIPLDSYDVLANVRPDIIMPQQNLLSIGNNNALHSSMAGFQELYSQDKLGIIQNVAYPNQNRSHFRSTDIWNTGSDAETYLKNGWFGRYLDQDHGSYPENYPNADNPDPLALTIGYTLSETCQGAATNYSLALIDPSGAGTVPDAIVGTITDDCYGDEYKFILDTIEQSNLYSERLLETYSAGTNLSTKYAEDSDLAQQLKTVARLINGGSKTKIFVLNQGGYDTHADQIMGDNSEMGVHATLLKTLSDAICAFQDDISLMGYGERVLGMTYSEFGRRIRSNSSLGTDHGTAAPMFLFGECVAGGILGDNPVISEDVDGQAGVDMQFDYRSIYASVLMDWFDVSEENVQSVLYADFQYLPILKNCAISTDVDNIQNQISELLISPNPTSGDFTATFDVTQGLYAMKIYDILGSEIATVFERKLTEGRHEIQVPVYHLISGQYVLRLVGPNTTKIKQFVKI